MDKVLKDKFDFENVIGSCKQPHSNIIEWKLCKRCAELDAYRAGKQGNTFSRESSMTKDKLHLRSFRAIEGKPRTNHLTFKVADGGIVVFMENGKDRHASIVLYEEHLKLLKEWLAQCEI